MAATSGTRLLPMEADVKEAFLRILKNRRKPKREPMVDGYGGFLFLDKNGRPMVALHWEKYMQHAREKYNREHLLQLPPITPHVCRHTYCTNMANSGMNPKTLQYLMGHSDVSVTLNIYTHTGYDDAKKEVDNFIRRLKRKNKSKNLPDIKYIIVDEYSEPKKKGSRGRIHLIRNLGL